MLQITLQLLISLELLLVELRRAQLRIQPLIVSSLPILWDNYASCSVMIVVVTSSLLPKVSLPKKGFGYGFGLVNSQSQLRLIIYYTRRDLFKSILDVGSIPTISTLFDIQSYHRESNSRASLCGFLPSRKTILNRFTRQSPLLLNEQMDYLRLV